MTWEEQRAALAATHADGAAEAVHEAACDCLSVDCMAYCYGGCARLDVTELLTELAEAGWCLVRT